MMYDASRQMMRPSDVMCASRMMSGSYEPNFTAPGFPENEQSDFSGVRESDFTT